MGHLQDGEWVTQTLKTREKDGEFKRPDTIFRNWITPDGSAGPTGKAGYKAEAGRYHLYLAWACPWAHRTLMFRKLKGLDDLISVSFVHPDMMDKGWSFDTDFPGSTGDDLYGKSH
ncbi:MAG: glutathione S-transferase family protein, partial [Pseudomonadota bacterium]